MFITLDDLNTLLAINSFDIHSFIYLGILRFIQGRLFVSYKSYLMLLKYTIGKTYIIAVSEVGQPLMVCRQEISQLSKRCDGHK